MIKLHRCTECGRIAEWHYIIGRGADGKTPSPKFGLNGGTKCWAPGEGTIGTTPHTLSPDFANPVTLPSVAVKP